MIEVRNLTRYYGDFAALDDVSFRIAEGQIVGLLGRNGAGKTTTLQVLAGLLLPSSGSVLVDGVDLAENAAALRSTIGFLPETPPLYGDMKVADFVRHVGRLRGLSRARVEAKLPEVLELTHLTTRADQVIETLSHGYKKRVGIAATIIHDPKLVILDEPISGLDPEQIVAMRDVIRGLSKGRSVIVSSHILSEVEKTCDWIVMLVDGRLAVEGTEAELAVHHQKIRLRLTVRGVAEAFAAFLRGHAAVDSVASVTPEGDFVTAEAVLAADGREQLAADLVAAGFGLRALLEAQTGLEELFLDLNRSAAAVEAA
jgi:ABC-2 type transport system ATP-binding protein